MKKLSIITQTNNLVNYSDEKFDSVLIFMRHSEDKILVKSGETVNIEIYNNGKLVFSGDKKEFFDKLTQ